jgi:hypothetical protein
LEYENFKKCAESTSLLSAIDHGDPIGVQESALAKSTLTTYRYSQEMISTIMKDSSDTIQPLIDTIYRLTRLYSK